MFSPIRSFDYLYSIEHVHPSVHRSVTVPERSQGQAALGLLPQQQKSSWKMRLFLNLFLSFSCSTQILGIKSLWWPHDSLLKKMACLLGIAPPRSPRSVPKPFLRNIPMVSFHACLGSGLSGFFSSIPLATSAMADIFDFVVLWSQASISCLPLSPSPRAQHTYTPIWGRIPHHILRLSCNSSKRNWLYKSLEDKEHFVIDHLQLLLHVATLRV